MTDRITSDPWHGWALDQQREEVPVERCWICGKPGTDAHPLVQVDPNIPSKCCTRHLPVIDKTGHQGTHQI